MYGKALFFMVLIVIGAVLPYLLADEEWLAKTESWFKAPSASADATGGETSTAVHGVRRLGTASSSSIDFGTTIETSVQSASSGVLQNPLGSPAPIARAGLPPMAGREIKLPRLVGPPGVSLEQLLSFDVTPDWISTNWSRVTTRLGVLNLQGWRVPFSHGDAESGLAGSITYFFDQERRVQRIKLHGYAGDVTELIQLGTIRYSMLRVPNTLSDLYAASVDGQRIGALRVDLAPVLRSENRGKRYEVLLELNRRGTSYGMSYEFSRIFERTMEENEVLTPIPAYPAPSPPQS